LAVQLGSKRRLDYQFRAISSKDSNSLLSAAFDEIVRNRKSVRVFDPNRGIEYNLVRKLLELSTLSPSSLNLQPYRVVVVSSPDMRQSLGDHAMLGGNSQRVKEAPYTIVFLADKGSTCHDFQTVTPANGCCVVCEYQTKLTFSVNSI
jgi:hypothetical protein